MFQSFPASAPVEDAVWIDLVEPTEEEAAKVAELSGLRLPTREALGEIESSSRTYMEKGAYYLSAPMIEAIDTSHATITPVGFILTDKRLITVRFAALKPVEAVAEEMRDGALKNPFEVFIRLMETLVDGGADRLEQAGADLDKISHAAFHVERTGQKADTSRKLREALRNIGLVGDRTSQIRDVLLGFGRIAAYICEGAQDHLDHSLHQRLNAVRADISSLNDYEGHLSNKVQFLLDATLGFISIEQNDTVKILTVVSVVGVPPVLIAGVYGMNFKFMPELGWHYGYPYSLALMVVSAILPLAWFKWRGWM